MPLITIDGPAGAGKSTIAGALAARLGLERLDTGAMYRAVTLLVLRAGAEPSDAARAVELAAHMDLELGARVVVNGEDVTKAIRSPEVDAEVSIVSAHPPLRAELVRRQRAWAAVHDGGVVEGRDIGSVVFPEADLKVYLTADPVERARRRADPIGSVHRRDTLDSSRVASPLQVPEGAIVVDSTDLSVDQVVEEVLRHL